MRHSAGFLRAPSGNARRRFAGPACEACHRTRWWESNVGKRRCATTATRRSRHVRGPSQQATPHCYTDTDRRQTTTHARRAFRETANRNATQTRRINLNQPCINWINEGGECHPQISTNDTWKRNPQKHQDGQLRKQQGKAKKSGRRRRGCRAYAPSGRRSTCRWRSQARTISAAEAGSRRGPNGGGSARHGRYGIPRLRSCPGSRDTRRASFHGCARGSTSKLAALRDVGQDFRRATLGEPQAQED